MRWGMIALVAVPWCAFGGLLAYDIHRARQLRDITEIVRRQNPEYKRAVERAELLKDTPSLKVVTYRWAYDRSDSLHVTMFGKYLMTVNMNEFGKGDVIITVFSDAVGARPLLMCGSTTEAGFPGYVAVYPQKGPEAGRVWYGDYDLDGKFEYRYDGPQLPPVAHPKSPIP